MIQRLWKRITRGKRTPGVFCGRDAKRGRRPEPALYQFNIYIKRHALVTLRGVTEPLWVGRLLLVLVRDAEEWI